MRLLLINANTSPSITDLVAGAARALVPPGTAIKAATGRFGARYVATRAAYAVAAHATLDAYAEHGADVDAVVIACFGDPGLFALRELAPVPVTGMAEAACLAAARRGRFAIVTGGAGWVPMLTEFVAQLGLSDRLAGIRAVAPSGAAIAADPEGSLAILADACRTAATQDGADVVILGGAGLVGLAPRLAAHVPVPLIDGLAASLDHIHAVAANDARPSADFAPVESVGLTPALAGLLAGRPVPAK